MNRRGFLSDLIQGAVAVTAAPQIVTHGLGLVRPRLIVPVMLYEWVIMTTVHDYYSEEAWLALQKESRYHPLNGGPASRSGSGAL